MKYASTILIGFVALGALSAGAAQVDAPAPPTSPLSAMFQLEDIYNRLSAGTPGAERTGGITGPTTGPIATRHTLNDVMAKAPAADNVNGTSAAQVLTGKTYWSLLGSTWGTGTGTMPNNGGVTITPGATNKTISLGFHDGTGIVTGDASLLAANIKSGISIFGVTGSGSVVDTTAGSALATDLLLGKTAFVSGALVTGTVLAGANVTGGSGALSFTIPNGLYSGSKTATAVEANLLAANIKSGILIFGVTGSSNVVDTSSGTATAGNLLNGKTAYVNGALVTGTVPAGINIAGGNGLLNFTIADGLYSGGKIATAADTNLISSNIKAGATVFGVTGSTNVVDTTQVVSPATAGNILLSKNAFVNGSGVTGTMSNNGGVTITPGTASQSIALGFHDGTGTVTGDVNLLSANIKSGVIVFGVAGSMNVVDTTQASVPAAAANILTGKIAFVNGVSVAGTMPNNGGVTISPGTINQSIALGYHDGTGKVNGDVNLLATNIKSGATIFGVAGSANVVDTSNGTAVASNILSGKTAYVAGVLVTGSVPVGSNLTGTNGSLAVAITDALYSGNKTATTSDTNLVAGNIASGSTIFGVAGAALVASGNAIAGNVLFGQTFSNNTTTGVTGTMPNNGAVVIAPGAAAQTIASGYHNGSGTVSGDANLLPANIKAGISIFGVAGSSSVVDTSAGTAVAGNILLSKTAFVNGSLVTGTVPAGANVAGSNGSLSVTITDGLYSGSRTATAADLNLVTGNIKSGATIFGVTGKSSVVDTSTGTAVAGDIGSGKTAFVNGSLLTGTASSFSSGNAVVNDVSIGKTFSNSTSNGIIGTRPTAAVAQTGQAVSYGTGDDGANPKGVVPPSPRFTDNANGTVTDNLTGLIWLKNANGFAGQTWTGALSSCNTLASGSTGLTDGSTAGQWRLPNAKELQSLIALQFSSPCLTNAAGTGQWTAGDPFTAVQPGNYYWSSNTFAGGTTSAYAVHVGVGDVIHSVKTTTYFVWPVRGGQ